MGDKRKRKPLMRADAIDVADPVSSEDFIISKQQEHYEADVICRKIYGDQIKEHLMHWSEQTFGSKTTTESTSTKPDRWKKVCSRVIKLLSVTSLPDGDDCEVITSSLLSGQASIDDAREALGETEHTEQLRRSVLNVIGEYQGLLEAAYLLLNAPRTGELSFSEEKTARGQQLHGFYKIVLGDKEDDKYPSMQVVVTTYDEIMKAVRHFIKFFGTKTKTATVVYNGHGGASGKFSLEDDPDAPSCSVFLRDIHDLWDEHKKVASDGEGFLPPKLTVVFAQCYGFVHTQAPEQSKVIEVVSLSSIMYPETRYTFDCGTGSGSSCIANSVHVELNMYAHQRSDSGAACAGGGAPDEAGGTSVDDVTGATSHRPVDPDIELSNLFFVPSFFATISSSRTFTDSRHLKRDKTAFNREEFFRKWQRLSHSWEKDDDRTTDVKNDGMERDRTGQIGQVHGAAGKKAKRVKKHMHKRKDKEVTDSALSSLVKQSMNMF